MHLGVWKGSRLSLGVSGLLRMNGGLQVDEELEQVLDIILGCDRNPT